MNECKKMKIPLTKPVNADQFDETVIVIRGDQRKPMSILFEEIEQAIAEKEVFVTNLLETLKQYNEEYLRKIDEEIVLNQVVQIVP